jgi:chemotaxis protein CheD
MGKPAYITEIFLKPGEFYFANQRTRIRTLLGSCVSITMWHPILRIGGMCHFMLQARGKEQQTEVLDGRYAEGAMQLFLRNIQLHGTLPGQYDVRLFGGGAMFPGINSANGNNVAQNNVAIARAMVKKHGLRVAEENLGGVGYRQIVFDLWSGDVLVKHVEAILSGGA